LTEVCHTIFGWFADRIGVYDSILPGPLVLFIVCLPKVGLCSPFPQAYKKVKKQRVEKVVGDFLMGTKIYVGNMSFEMDNMSLDEMFKPFGAVVSAQVIMDRDSGRSKGFGFVEMGSEAEAQAAISALNGKEVGGRALTVNEAKPREDRPRSGGGSRGGFGGGRSGGGRGGRY
jgi:RNA recognition motif-containing protein